MKDIKTLIGFTLSLLILGVAYAADETPCISALTTEVTPAEAVENNLDRHFAELAKSWNSGWTDRGYLGMQDNSPALDAEPYMYALKNGLMWWNLRIYFVKDIEEARAHDALVTDSMMKGVYVVGADEAEVEFKSEEDADKARRSLKGETLRAAIERASGFIQFLPDGSVKKVEMPEIDKRLNFTVVAKIKPDYFAFEKNCFVHEGWVATKKRGLLYYNDEWHKSSSVQRGRKLARRLIALGYQIKVNGDYKHALDMARDQKRRVIEDGEEVLKQNSRYQSEPLYNAALAMYEKDLAFSVEIYRPDGKMVGGSINFVSGNLVTGDTIFYDIDETSYIDEVGQVNQIDPIEYARLVDVLTFDYMGSLGIKIMDLGGQVSNYSATLGGKYVPREKYLEESAALPTSIVRLPSILDPYHDTGFAELAKGAKVKGLTKSLFLGGYQLQNAATEKKALEQNLVPAELIIHIVKDSSAAEEHAKANGYKDNVIYFMDGQCPVEIANEEGAPANKLIECVLRNGAVVVDPSKGKAKLILAQRFKGILNSKLSTQYMSWKMDSVFGNHVIVKGWRAQ